MAAQLNNDPDADSARIITALLETGDIEAAKQCRGYLEDVLAWDTVAVIGRSLSTWETYPYEIAKDKHRDFWQHNPRYRTLIAALIPAHDPSPPPTRSTADTAQSSADSATIRTRAELAALAATGPTPDYLAFSDHRPEPDGRIGAGCLSQWWPAPFTLGGVEYPTAEHWMMVSKARLMGDHNTAARILACGHPSEAKQLGRRVRPFDAARWDAMRFDLVVCGNIAKFTQHPELNTYLQASAGQVIVEASPWDRVWGIGIAAGDARVHQPEQWRGSNLLGFALMEVRTRLGGTTTATTSNRPPTAPTLKETTTVSSATEKRSHSVAHSETQSRTPSVTNDPAPWNGEPVVPSKSTSVDERHPSSEPSAVDSMAKERKTANKQRRSRRSATAVRQQRRRPRL